MLFKRINKEGGCARITNIHFASDGINIEGLDVKYVVSGGSEKKLDPSIVAPFETGSGRGSRKRRGRDFLHQEQHNEHESRKRRKKKSEDDDDKSNNNNNNGTVHKNSSATTKGAKQTTTIKSQNKSSRSNKRTNANEGNRVEAVSVPATPPPTRPCNNGRSKVGRKNKKSGTTNPNPNEPPSSSSSSSVPSVIVADCTLEVSPLPPARTSFVKVSQTDTSKTMIPARRGPLFGSKDDDDNKNRRGGGGDNDDGNDNHNHAETTTKAKSKSKIDRNGTVGKTIKGKIPAKEKTKLLISKERVSEEDGNNAIDTGGTNQAEAHTQSKTRSDLQLNRSSKGREAVTNLSSKEEPKQTIQPTTRQSGQPQTLSQKAEQSSSLVQKRSQTIDPSTAPSSAAVVLPNGSRKPLREIYENESKKAKEFIKEIVGCKREEEVNEDTNNNSNGCNRDTTSNVNRSTDTTSAATALAK